MEAAANTVAQGDTGNLSLHEAANLLLPEESGEQETVDAQTESVESADDVELSDVESDELQADEYEEEASQQPELITLKVDGVDVQVTLDELKSGYSRQSDYTRKTQELAQQRKVAEQEIAVAREERTQYANVLQQLAQQIQTAQEPDWDTLRRTDPIEYSLQMADWQRRQQQLQALHAEQMRVSQLSEIETQRAFVTEMERQTAALHAALPTWKDPAKAKAEKALIVEQGKKLGFTEEELQNVTDHRAVIALRKAAMFDQIMAKKSQLTAVPQKTMAPKAKVADAAEGRRAYDRLKQSGSIADAAKAVESLLFNK